MAGLDRALAGFVGGVADYGLDQLKSRQDEEREVRKAKLLEDLRASTAERLAAFEDNLRQKRGDKQFSGAEGDEFVVRNDRGNEVNRRALTAEEKRTRDLSMRGDELAIRNVESQIASRARDDARQDRVANANIAASNRSGRSLDGGTSGPSLDANSLAQGLVNRYKSLLGEGEDKIDELVAFDIAQEALEYAANTNGGTKVVEDYFLNKIRSAKGGSVSGRKVRFVE